MYKVNDIVVYKRDLCKVVEIRKNKLTNLDSYIMVPILDESLKIEVPVDNNLSYIRSVISKEEADNLIKKIPNIKTLQLDSKNLDSEYKYLYNSASLEDLITIIKTTYLRNDERLKTRKKVSEKDSAFFEKAEKSLYNELAISFNMSYQNTRDYVINEMKKLEKN